MATKRQETAALRRLIDQLGADIVLQKADASPRDRGERLGPRIAADDRCDACEACDLRGGCKRPLTPIWPQARLDRAGRVAVIGEAPSWEEERAGALDHGRAGSVLARTMAGAGVPADRVTYLTAVACWPNNGPRASKPPTLQQAVTCRQNLMVALDAADVDYVILLGAWATRAWRGDLGVTAVAGGMYLWQQRWFVLPIEHTNSVLREGATVEARTWRDHVVTACQRVISGAGFEEFSHQCVKCTAPMYGWDEDGVPWCAEHFNDGRGGRVKANRTKPADTQQGALL